jgi:Holliday junction resolvase RusA-like endonuclease
VKASRRDACDRETAPWSRRGSGSETIPEQRETPEDNATRQAGQPAVTVRLSAPPPSTNALYLYARGKRVRAPAYRRWAERAAWEMVAQAGRRRVTGAWTAHVVLPKTIRGDLDNRLKGLVDAVVRAGITADDRFLTGLTVEKTGTDSAVTITVRGGVMSGNPTLSNSLTDLAIRIKAEHEAAALAMRRGVEHAMAAGNLLIEAKAQLKHGQWLPWLEVHCAMSERTAQLYMRLAQRRPELEASNPQGLADLTLEGASRLLSKPAENDAAEQDTERDIFAEPFTDFDFEDHPQFPFWLQYKLARAVGLPKHVQVALSAMDDYDLPVLSMCTTEDIAEAMKLIAPYIKEEKFVAISTVSISPLIAFVDLKIASQRIFVALWHEVVEERKKFTAEQLYQRAEDCSEKFCAAVEHRLAERAEAVEAAP